MFTSIYLVTINRLCYRVVESQGVGGFWVELEWIS